MITWFPCLFLEMSGVHSSSRNSTAALIMAKALTGVDTPSLIPFLYYSSTSARSPGCSAKNVLRRNAMGRNWTRDETLLCFLPTFRNVTSNWSSSLLPSSLLMQNLGAPTPDWGPHTGRIIAVGMAGYPAFCMPS